VKRYTFSKTPKQAYIQRRVSPAGLSFRVPNILLVHAGARHFLHEKRIGAGYEFMQLTQMIRPVKCSEEG
jgi:hypothetical protein